MPNCETATGLFRSLHPSRQPVPSSAVDFRSRLDLRRPLAVPSGPGRIMHGQRRARFESPVRERSQWRVGGLTSSGRPAPHQPVRSGTGTEVAEIMYPAEFRTIDLILVGAT